MNTLTKSQFINYLPLLVPLILIQLSLAIWTGRQILKQNSFFYLNRALWLIIVLFLQFFGPVAYLVFGKKEKL